jgi:hypothetical protein
VVPLRKRSKAHPAAGTQTIAFRRFSFWEPSWKMEASAVLPSTIELLMEAPLSPLSSRPERTRISCHAALDKAAYAPFRKEGRMKCTSAIKLHRKSGGAQWRDLQFSGLVLEMFSTGATTTVANLVWENK